MEVQPTIYSQHCAEGMPGGGPINRYGQSGQGHTWAAPHYTRASAGMPASGPMHQYGHLGQGGPYGRQCVTRAQQGNIRVAPQHTRAAAGMPASGPMNQYGQLGQGGSHGRQCVTRAEQGNIRVAPQHTRAAAGMPASGPMHQYGQLGQGGPYGRQCITRPEQGNIRVAPQHTRAAGGSYGRQCITPARLHPGRTRGQARLLTPEATLDNWRTDTERSKGPKDMQSPWGDEPETEEEEPEIEDENTQDESDGDWDATPKDKDKPKDDRGEWDPTKDHDSDGDWDATPKAKGKPKDDRGEWDPTKDHNVPIGELTCLADCMKNSLESSHPAVTDLTTIKKYYSDCLAKCIKNVPTLPTDENVPTLPDGPYTTQEVNCFKECFVNAVKNISGIAQFSQVQQIYNQCLLQCMKPLGGGIDPNELLCFASCLNQSLSSPPVPLKDTTDVVKYAADCMTKCCKNKPCPQIDPNAVPPVPVTPEKAICIADCFLKNIFDPAITSNDQVIERFIKCIQNCKQPPGPPYTPDQQKCIAECIKKMLDNPSTILATEKNIVDAEAKCVQDCTGVVPPTDPSTPDTPVSEKKLLCYKECMKKSLDASPPTNYKDLMIRHDQCIDSCKKDPDEETIDDPNVPDDTPVTPSEMDCLFKCLKENFTDTVKPVKDAKDILARLNECAQKCLKDPNSKDIVNCVTKCAKDCVHDTKKEEPKKEEDKPKEVPLRTQSAARSRNSFNAMNRSHGYTMHMVSKYYNMEDNAYNDAHLSYKQINNLHNVKNALDGKTC